MHGQTHIKQSPSFSVATSLFPQEVPNELHSRWNVGIFLNLSSGINIPRTVMLDCLSLKLESLRCL